MAQTLEALLLPAVGLAVGAWLDRRWATAPWLALGGGLVGLVASARILVQMIKSLDRNE